MSTGLTSGHLARLLGLPSPTAEQARVISADTRPRAVVAGAGSGKSETVAARVVWLVANRVVRPEQVLGLTFTRKAAGELAARVRARLARLRDAGVVPAAAVEGEPTVGTYHSYAARLVTEHAAREAREPSLRLVTPAVQWQLAARVVAAYDGPMDAVPWTPGTVTTAVLELAGELGEHLRRADEVRAEGDRLRRRVEQQPGRPPGAVSRLLGHQEAREQLLPLVERYAQAKAAREVMDYSDQVALAARIAERHPEVGAIERSRYGVVLLDEYQDTGYAQLALLRSLFGPPHGRGHPVMAVGDPCQSIYGWRGAAAGNLTRFGSDFPPTDGPAPSPAPPSGRAPLLARSADDLETRSTTPARSSARCSVLSVSFRGGERILGVAGELSGPLRRETSVATGTDSGASDPPGGLPLRPGPERTGRGRVGCGLFESVHTEAAWVADRVAEVLALPPGTAPDGGPWPDAGAPRGDSALAWVQPADVAVLARKRAQFPALRRAMERRGIPVEVVGLGGLLTVPEVADVVTTLRVLADPAAGDALARILTGPRWRIGPRDLAALGRRARELARMAGRDVEGAPAPSSGGVPPGACGAPKDPAGFPAGDGDPVEQLVADMTAAEEASLVDALDGLGAPDRYSPAGYARLSALAEELRELRGRVGQPLPDLVTEVERALGLDVEVATRPELDPVTARADLDAFADAAARFAGAEEEPTLGAFLAYLSAAEDQEFGLEAGRVSEANSVKLMTVHAAKGLEWPAVVVPGLSAGESSQAPRVFPARPRTSTAWTDNPRKLPFPLRGDRAELPELCDLDRESYERFTRECRQREELEERRLAYVAATRASFLLLCSGYWWGEAKTPLGPSVFLREVRQACLSGAGEVVKWAPEPPDGAENPHAAEPRTAWWPADPGGPRQEAVADGAGLVEKALARREEGADPQPEPAPQPRPTPVLDGDAEPERHPQATEPGEAGTYDDPLAGPTGEDRSRAAGWALDERLLLAERHSASRDEGMAVDLPGDLPVSALVTLARDPAELARRVRRPMPAPPAPQARRGTAFHRWLESRYGQLRLLDPHELPGAADDGAAPDEDLAELQRRFARSGWAALTPVEVEVPFETTVGDRQVRGRMDAVFRDAGGRYDVVDWKTGARPAGREAEEAAVQLAAYRLAWAELAGVPVESVRAAFHYVRTDETVRPVDLLGAHGLAALVRRVPTA